MIRQWNMSHVSNTSQNLTRASFSRRSFRLQDSMHLAPHDMLARTNKLSETYRRSFFKPSSSCLSRFLPRTWLGVSHVQSPSASPGCLPLVVPFSFRLAPDFASPVELPFLLFLFPRDLSLSPSLYPFSSSNLASVSSFPILCCTSLSSAHRRSLFPFAERAILPPQCCRNWSIGEKMLREGRSNRRTATLISLPAHIPDSDGIFLLH